MTLPARFAFTVLLCAVAAAPAAASRNAVPLARVAADNGYVYAWLPSEAAVSLSRPGVVVVLRAGQELYRVGDVVVAADRAPEYDGTDLVVSPAVAANLRRIAQAYPLPPPPARPPTPATTATGALTVEARQIVGRDAIAISGHGPADVPVTVVLSGEISRDLPLVIFSRTSTRTAADGSFSVDIGIVAGQPRDTTIVASVTSLKGVTPANARLVLKAPSPAVDSPLDRLPQ